MSTQIILTSRVENLGAEGDTVTVADGYARNYLIPKGLAMPASAGNLKRVEALRQKREAHAVAELEQAKELAAKLSKASFTIAAAAGADEKLYGSVTSTDIAEALKKEGIEIDRRKIVLEHPIRTTGVFDVEVKLHAEVPAKMKIYVEAVAGEAPTAAPAKERPKKATKKK
jgi:large subunit ribosomal protein L9